MGLVLRIQTRNLIVQRINLLPQALHIIHISFAVS
jgi:hypothetical protein